MTDMKSLIDNVAKAKEHYQDQCKQAFKDVLKDYFSKTGSQAIVWGQYTPSFNDGDPCVFSLTEIYCISKGFSEDDLKEPYDYDSEDYDFDQSEETSQLINFLDNNSAMLEDMFGNDVVVYATPEKIIVEEYDCGY